MTEDDLPFSKEKQVRPVWRCRKETEGCARSAPCPSCLGRRNKRKGQKKQADARKKLGVPDAKFRTQLGHEENWQHPLFRAEVKSGAQVGPIATRFLAGEKQAEQNRRIGDSRWFVHVAMPDGWSDGIVSVRLSVWNSEIAPQLEEG